MKNIVINWAQSVFLVLSGFPVYAGTSIGPSTGTQAAIEQPLAIATTAPMGVGGSWAEEEDLSLTPEYKLKPEYIEALRLTPKQAKALRAYMPKFKQWSIWDYPVSIRKHYPHSMSQLPYAVSGDFDGNGLRDIIVAGHAGEERVILAVMSEGRGYYILPISEYIRDTRFPELDVLFLLKRGTRFAIDGENYSGPEEVISRDGLQHTAIWGNTPRFSGVNAANQLSRYSEGFKSVELVSVSSAAPAPFKPEYLKKMSLPPSIKNAVHAYDKDFSMWELRDYPSRITKSYPYSKNSLPYAVRGDFNGDGIEDMVIDGHNADENRTLVLLSSGTGYSVTAWNGNQQCYLETRKHGRQIPYMPSTVLKMHGGGLQAHLANGGQMVLRSDVFSYQQILSCAINAENSDENSAATVRYGDWHEVNEPPSFFGYIKKFDSESYHGLRILERSMHEEK